MIDLQVVDRYGRNALHKICAKGDFEKYTAAIVGVTDFTARTNNGSTYLHYAVQSHSVEICRHLLSQGLDPADAGHNGGTPIHLAADCYDTDILALLMEHAESPIPSTLLNESLVAACGAAEFYNHFEPIEFLLSKGADINPGALDAACLTGNIKLVKYLIERGADVNEKVGSSGWPLIYWVKTNKLKNSAKIVKLLKESGAVDFSPH